MKQSLTALRRNINSGTRLCLLRRCEPGDFSVSLDQLVLLIALNFLLAFFLDLLISLPHPEFSFYAVAANGLDVLLFLFAAYLIGKLLTGKDAALRLGVYIYSMSPFLLLLWVLLARLGDLAPQESMTIYGVAYLLYLAWVIIAILWAITLLAGGFSRKVPAAFLVMILAWMLPVYYFADDATFWYPSAEGGVDEYAAYRELDVERMFYRQPELLSARLESLLAERSGRDDLYFVGFAGYALQDVFRNEIQFARALFDRRFDTQGRSLVLINNLATRKTLPLATSVNLERTLSVNFWPLRLNDMTPVMLKQYLDAAAIKWRIIMVSACYSGGFIETLKDENTAIMTAAAVDRMSFGCDDERELTYFGEALLQNQLQSQFSIAAAFEDTAKEIELREQAEQLDPSHPQIYIGKAMQEKLQRLETRLVRHDDPLILNP